MNANQDKTVPADRFGARNGPSLGRRQKKSNSITARKRLAHQRTLPLPLQKRRSDLDASICSIGHISRLQRVLDNDAEYVTPLDMLAELRVALEVEAYAARFLDHIEQAAAALAWLWKL
jgi:hypothetical protein